MVNWYLVMSMSFIVLLSTWYNQKERPRLFGNIMNSKMPGKVRVEFKYTRLVFWKWPTFRTTAGNGGNVLSRINYNEFIQEITTNHAFYRR